MSSLSFHVSDPELSEVAKLQERQARACAQVDGKFSHLFDVSLDPEVIGKKNCENFIGSVEVPVGVAGPVTANSKEIILPLATTEGALVASIQRGCKAINLAGGAQILTEKKGISRAPVFRCKNGAHAREFVQWLEKNMSALKMHAESTSAHLKYLSHQTWIRGRHVYVRFVFDSDQAMGMNMVTIALQKMWEAMRFPDVELIALSSNVCADKKDSVVNRLYGRGFWVQAEVTLSEHIFSEVLHTNADELLAAHYAKNLVGSNVAGSFSQNMQVGNAVAALYLATGQDMAHVTEGSQASTTIERDGSDIYFAVTMPNIVIGVVGGGTWLPSQTETRQLMANGQQVTSELLATAVATAALAAEISGMSAVTTNTLAQAHQKLGRL